MTEVSLCVEHPPHQSCSANRMRNIFASISHVLLSRSPGKGFPGSSSTSSAAFGEQCGQPQVLTPLQRRLLNLVLPPGNKVTDSPRSNK